MVSFLISLACLLLILLAGLLRLRSRPRAMAQDLDWFGTFSLEPYQVMQRLLRPDDFQFLRLQAGYSSALERRLRRGRRQILRLYLRQLERDFRRLQAVARLKAACSPQGSPEMSLILLQSSLLFRVWRLRMEWVILRVGNDGGNRPNIELLISSVELLHLQIKRVPG